MEAHGQLMLSANVRRPGTKYKRSNIAFAITSIAFIVVHVCTELLQLPVQCPIGVPGTITSHVFGDLRRSKSRFYHHVSSL